MTSPSQDSRFLHRSHRQHRRFGSIASPSPWARRGLHPPSRRNRPSCRPNLRRRSHQPNLLHLSRPRSFLHPSCRLPRLHLSRRPNLLHRSCPPNLPHPSYPPSLLRPSCPLRRSSWRRNPRRPCRPRRDSPPRSPRCQGWAHCSGDSWGRPPTAMLADRGSDSLSRSRKTPVIGEPWPRMRWTWRACGGRVCSSMTSLAGVIGDQADV